MNNFNINKLTSKKHESDNTYSIDINKDNINLINSNNSPKLMTKMMTKLMTRSNLTKKINNKNHDKKKSKKSSKKLSKKKSKKNTNTQIINKQKRVNPANIDFPHGNNFKCIGPCYPANTLYYHPLTLQAIKSKSNSCPTELHKINDKIKIKDKCTLNENYDYEAYDMFADIIQVATSDDTFLKQIYNIKNMYDVELFLENEIKQLPNYSQKRIINSIYKVYRDDDTFPSNNFVDIVKLLIKKNYDVKIKSKIILSKIMDNKYKNNDNDLFTNLLE